MLATALGCAISFASFVAPAHAGNWFYQQTNLVSNASGPAPRVDPLLVNPWGIARSATSPFWVANNGTGTSTLYNGSGQPFPLNQPLAVTVPPAPGNTTGTPTGIVFNATSDFVVSDGTHSGAAVFLWATEDGTIAGWNPNVNPTVAIQAADNSSQGAVYKGLATGTSAIGNVLYATNFFAGTIDVFDASLTQVTLDGPFVDKHAAGGYGPFGIANIGGQIFVTYALQDEDRHDDVAGVGKGFVDVFDQDGHFIQRFAQSGRLNSPWGMTQAPDNFGQFSKALIVGNFGDGHILGFDLETRKFIGQLSDPRGKPLAIPGLWGLAFGNGANAGPTNRLFFNAGGADEQTGLFGFLRACLVSGGSCL
jgi:uncharacterized protein (TIGR03118 family)